MKQTTTNSKIIQADKKAIYRAFTEPEKLVSWLAPYDMTGKIHNFKFKIGGGYEMSLFYNDETIEGKTAGNEDRFSAKFTEIIPYNKIVQAIRFNSDKNGLEDEMIMEVYIDEVATNTCKVTIIFKNIPQAISPKANEDGTEQSLEKLAKLVEAN